MPIYGYPWGWSTGSSVTYNWSMTFTTSNSTLWTASNSTTTTNWHTDREWVELGYIEPTPRQVAQDAAQVRAARLADQVAAERERARSRTVATDRAMELLLSLLTERQRASVQRSRHFDVVGNLGGRFRIHLHMGSSGNIEWLRRSGRVGGRICAHPSMHEHWLPIADVALSQMLAITTDERAFVCLANIHEGAPPPARELLAVG